MKNEKLLSVLLVLVMGGLLFISCSEDDKEEEVFNHLNGTVWKGTDLDSYIGNTKIFDGTYGFLETHIDEMTVYLYGNTSNITINYYYEWNGYYYEFDSNEVYDYTYSNSKAILTPKSGHSLLGIVEVTFNGNQMSILNKKTGEAIKLQKVK